MIIAIDGPAASGKSSLARRISHHYDLPHLNTGALYRAVARDVLLVGQNLQNADFAAEVASRIDFNSLADPSLHQRSLGEAASIVAAFPQVRQALLGLQRDFIQNARRERGAVVEGRDIGTVICPDADKKLYIVAEPETRARRRYLELSEQDSTANENAIFEDLKKRDERDASRTDAPLQCAADAHLLDTTKLDIEASLKVALDYINMVKTHA